MKVGRLHLLMMSVGDRKEPLAEKCKGRSDYGCRHQQVLIPPVSRHGGIKAYSSKALQPTHMQTTYHTHLICASNPAVLLCCG